jgi:hypothetical protein
VPRRGGPRAATCAALLSAAIAAAGIAPGASAQPAMKPGLWEVQVSGPEIDAARRQYQEQLAKMPPERRAQMEKAMGGSIGGMMGGRPARVCLTDADLKERGPVGRETGCKTKNSVRGPVHVVDMQCDDGRTGHGEFTFTAESYRGYVEMSDPRRPGKRRVEQEGRWLGTDCGDVRPPGPVPGGPAGPGARQPAPPR